MNVQAAPNRCLLDAVVLAVRPDSAFPDRSLLALRVQQVSPLSGGVYAAPGDEVEALLFGADAAEGTLSPEELTGRPVRVEAEFIGGPQRPLFRIERLIGQGGESGQGSQDGS